MTLKSVYQKNNIIVGLHVQNTMVIKKKNMVVP